MMRMARMRGSRSSATDRRFKSMSGAANGSALANIRRPRLCGYRATGLMANPCPTGYGKDGDGLLAGWNTNCRSGLRNPGTLLMKAADSKMLLASGPRLSSAYSARFARLRGMARQEIPYEVGSTML